MALIEVTVWKRWMSIYVMFMKGFGGEGTSLSAAFKKRANVKRINTFIVVKSVERQGPRYEIFNGDGTKDC